jgi:hypothetical protein
VSAKPTLPTPPALGAVLPVPNPEPASADILDALVADDADEHRYRLAAATHDEDEGGVIEAGS